MFQFMPFFSIVTPLYNKAEFFHQTIASVLNQSFSDWEWIIVDDGSTDGGPRLARGAAEQNPKVALVSQKNTGPCSARNHGIRLARGKWVLFLDADDVLLPSYLEEISNCCQGSNAGIHAGGWAEYDASLQECVCLHRPAGAGEKGSLATLFNSAIAFAPWHPAAAVVRRDLLIEKYLWEESMNRLLTEDTVFWWRLIASFPVKLESFCGVKYRRGTTGCRDQVDDFPKWGEGLMCALKWNLDFLTASRLQPNPMQVKNLVNVLSRFAFEAASAGHDVVSCEAYKLADSILHRAPWKTLKIILWKVACAQRAERFKRMLRKAKNG